MTIKTASLEEMEFLLSLARDEGWNPGIEDARPFHLTDPEGFFIGEAGGNKIGCISAVAYNDSYGFLGFYIVKPEYRGLGYGIRLWNRAMDYLGGRCAGLDGVVGQQENYKKSGFNLFYRNIRFKGKGAPYSPPSTIVEASKEAVASYDEAAIGLARERFLEPWLLMSNAAALAKIEGRLKGYGVIRKCWEGFKIGPLFADDAETAEELFRSLAAKAGTAPVFLDVPESNPEAVALAKKMEMEKVFETARMYTRSPPDQQLCKIFGVTTFELG